MDINPEHLSALCPELKAILDGELQAGNKIAETGSGWPREHSVLVMLQRPFLLTHTPLPDGVRYVEVNDPHWWKAEFDHEETAQILACRFGHW